MAAYRGPNPGTSGSDPRGRVQNQGQYQQGRFEEQYDPFANQAGENYGYGSQRNRQDYANSMNQYDQFLSGQNQGPPQLQGVTRDPRQIDQWLQWQANQEGADPILKTQEGRDYYAGNIIKTDGLHPGNTDYWKKKSTLAQYGGAVGSPEGGGGGGSSYGYGMSPMSQAAFGSAMQGFQRFADTGGYSDSDMANLRARGASPIRAAYANAEREIGRQRSLQGGYAPNAIATQAKMAREQGQATSDAMQNVNAGIVDSRNQNMLAGNEGLSKTGLAGAGLGLDYDQLKQAGFLGAMAGKTSLYGATPGMANTFGNQALTGQNMSGQFGIDMMGRDIEGQKLPGSWDTKMNRTNDVMDLINAGTGAASQFMKNKQQQPTGGMTSYGGGIRPSSTQTRTPIQNVNFGAGGTQQKRPFGNVRF